MIKKIVLSILCIYGSCHASEPKFEVGEFVLIKDRPWLADYKGFAIGKIKEAQSQNDIFVYSGGKSLLIRFSFRSLMKINDELERKQVEAVWRHNYESKISD